MLVKSQIHDIAQCLENKVAEAPQFPIVICQRGHGWYSFRILGGPSPVWLVWLESALR